MRGFLLIDKGIGITSFDVVYKVRKWAQEKTGLRLSVGHAGTLDPLATGLLIVAVGEATKLLEYFIGFDKEYEVRAKFGAISDTYDREGKIEVLNEKKMQKYVKFTRKSLEKLISTKFVGAIEQVPPKYSALKINGQRAMDLARKGEDFEMKARKVMIYDLKVGKFAWPEVVMSVKCGSGTYIRSLVHDIGQAVGCGAYVKELRRLSINKYNLDGENVLEVNRDFNIANKNIEQCLESIEDFVGLNGREGVDARCPDVSVVPGDNFQSVSLIDKEYIELRHGRTILSNKFEHGGVMIGLFKGKVVGVLEKSLQPGTIKFRKRIFE